jgi:hypothetical protein
MQNLKNCLLLLILMLFSPTLSAQISEGGMPHSYAFNKMKSTGLLPSYKLKSLNISGLLEEDLKNPVPFRYGIVEEKVIDIKSYGAMEILPDGSGKIWRLKILTEGAKSIQVFFKEFRLPSQAKLFIYNDGYQMIAGAYTNRYVKNDTSFVLADFRSDHAVIEYFEPLHPDREGRIVIGSIGQAYKDIFEEESGDTYVNINCQEGKDLQLPKHAVCKITFKSNGNSYLCSGSLINNTRQDGTPYFLTASHCLNDSAEAATLVAYFNFENEGCNGEQLVPKTLSGATLLSTGQPSDYTLMLLNNDPLPGYQPYFAGWDATGLTVQGVSSIHHPFGQTKKLSIDNDLIESNTVPIQWNNENISPISSHWQVNFDVGLTAGGSSGGPLFNDQKQIIGQLHGGDDTYDLYGKISYSWTHSAIGYATLKSFLDPENSGILVLVGYSPPDNPPDAFFTLPFRQVCKNARVLISDYSVFGPYERTWTISPPTFTYLEGTSESSPNPVISFNDDSFYSIKLKLSNAGGVDSMEMTNAIIAGSTINVNVTTSPSDEVCLYDFTSVRLTASGADNYSWGVAPMDADKVMYDSTSGDTVEISPLLAYNPDSTDTISLFVIGTQGVCVDTGEITYKVIKPYNDDIERAYQLNYGKSKTYSNHCATIEPGEPQPLIYSCTSQYSWCDEYGTGENIVENSVWFTFTAGETGLVSISSSGFDNQIALYDANSANDILHGNYEIIAANDDRSTTDFNPLIRSASVTPGKTYWIQVDGSAGGQEGDFYLVINALISTSLNDMEQPRFYVYPLPADRVIFFAGKSDPGQPVYIAVYDASGMLVYQEAIPDFKGEKMLQISGWKPGLYIARILTGSEQHVLRFIKQ